MNFIQWLNTFIEEKGINTDRILEAEGASGTNFIPVECIVERMKQTVGQEQKQIKDIIVKIDFHNGDVYHFLQHLAQGMAQ